MTTIKDLRLGSEDDTVVLVEFATWWFRIQIGNADLRVNAPFEVEWPDGAREMFDPSTAAGNPASARLLSIMLEAHVTESVAGVESSFFDISFDNGVKFHYRPTYSRWEDWSATSPDGVNFYATTTDELDSWGGRAAPASGDATEADEGGRYAAAISEAAASGTGAGSPEAAETAGPAAAAAPDWDEGTGARLLDLGISDRVYGVTVTAESVQLDTRVGDIQFLGPFTLVIPDGRTLVYDPRAKESDPNSGLVLDLLIDSTIQLATLVPETSELQVTFAGGMKLSWSPITPGQGQFRARQLGGRQFWSAGDGTVYWYGGAEGEHPEFLVGGARRSD